MYSQGNYGPQYGSPAPLIPASYQRGPPAPPAPYQQGPPVPSPYQQGPLTPSPTVLPHGPPAPTPPVQQVHPPTVHVTPPGMLSMGQLYFNQPPSVHGSSPMVPSYQTSQQPSPYIRPMASQNVHITGPPVPLHSGPPLSGPSPPPPRVFPPPPPSTGQMLYRTLPPPPHGNMQGPQPVRPLPPPPRSGFLPVTPATYGSFMHASVEDAHPPSMPPPPPPLPPSSPPPLPPSPPPPSSPPPNVAVFASDTSSIMPSDPALDIHNHLESDICSDKISDYTERTIDHVDKAFGHTQFTDDAHIPVIHTYDEVGPHCEMDSPMADGASSKADVLMNLPSPPPKPVEEEVVRNIEVLCQFIAKVGPDFENLARTKESENPKFAFLFGGEPGSATAIGHEYFLWMKRKCDLEFKLHNESEHQQNDSVLRPSEMESPLQSVSSVDGATSVSPALSDMDMEDDVIQPEKDHGMYQPAEDFHEEPVSADNEASVVKQPVNSHQSSTKPSSENAKLENIYRSGPSQEVSGQGKEDNQSSFTRSRNDDLSSARSPLKDMEITLSTSFQESAKPIMEDLSAVKLSLAAAGGNNEEIPRVFVNNGSPFRLIQDYASDDSVEDDKMISVEDVSPVRVSSAVSVGTSGLHEDEGADVCSNIVSKKVFEIETRSNMESVMTEAIQHSDCSLVSHEVALETVTLPDASDAVVKTDDPNVGKGENLTISDSAISSKAFKNVISQGDDVNIDSQSGQVHKEEDAKRASATLNVDEFGRLVREGVSDSDSDGMHYSRRFGKRGRSPSPQESKWRRRKSRSPWRRNRRSRSRSWSPKKQRSRSKSPLAFRRTGEFGSEKMRRDIRGQPPECFDFLRGKCYRGASCRYLHSDSAPSNAPRRSRNKKEQYHEIPPDSRNSDVHGDAHYVEEAHDTKNIVTELGSDGHGILQEEGKSRDIQTRQDLSVGSTEAARDEGLDEKTETGSVKDDVQPSEIDHSLVTVTVGEIGQCQGSQEADAIEPETQVQEIEEACILIEEKHDSQQPLEIPNPISTPAAETQHLLGDIPMGQDTGEIPAAEPPSSNVSCSNSLPELQSHVPHPLHVDGSSISHSSPIQAFPSTTNPNQAAPLSHGYPSQVHMSQPYPNQLHMSQPYPLQINASQSLPHESVRPPLLPAKQFHPHNFSVGDFRFQPSQLPPPPYVSLPQGNLNASHALQPPDQNQLRPPVANFQSQPVAVEGFPCQPHIVDYNSQSTPPSKPFWTDLPPPPPHVNESIPRPAIPRSDFLPSQFQQTLMPTRDDVPSQPLMRSHPSEELTHSRVSGFQPQTFPYMAESRQPPLHMEEFRTISLEADNRRDQPFRGSTFMREEPFARPVIPESNEFIPRTLQDYGMHPPLRERGRVMDTESFLSRPPTFPRESTSMHVQSFPGDSLSLRSFSREGFSSPAKNFPYSRQQQSSFASQLPATGGFSSHLGVPGNVDSSLSRYPPGLSDVGSKVSSSTHYNPFASTFEQTPYGSKFGSSSKLGRELTTGDQYDPLYDSIEPSTNMFRKIGSVSERDSTIEVISENVAVRPVTDTVPTLRLSGSHVPLDVEENNKQKEGVTIVKPHENDDFDGAATDAEIGAVENGSPRPGEGKNWSPDIPNDLVNTGAGEIEIDQVQTSGKSKSKDSRLMKLFKIAIADFVKEVLKPSWRQGNMSKEAFKTIVKKTVDKVSGAMQSHQIPKSQAKINQYVESSQRKLTKLVMGYVDKYVKV